MVTKGGGSEMLKHHITKYRDEKGNKKAVAWLQLNLFGRAWCFCERRIDL